jgi:hypothetical protein
LEEYEVHRRFGQDILEIPDSVIFVLKNELATQLVVAACKDNFQLLYQFKAGRMGPINIQSYKQMCSNVCLQNDVIHQEVIEYTECSCLELSTKADADSLNVEENFCRENSARLLCEAVGYCGVWGCRIDDFMCPRYEFNKKWFH